MMVLERMADASIFEINYDDSKVKNMLTTLADEYHASSLYLNLTQNKVTCLNLVQPRVRDLRFHTLQCAPRQPQPHIISVPLQPPHNHTPHSPTLNQELRAKSTLHTIKDSCNHPFPTSIQPKPSLKRHPTHLLGFLTTQSCQSCVEMAEDLCVAGLLASEHGAEGGTCEPVLRGRVSFLCSLFFWPNFPQGNNTKGTLTILLASL